MNLLTISIVHYGKDKHTSSLINTLLSETELPENTEIVLVKNSPIETPFDRRIITIQAKGNIGFGKGHNLAFKKTRSSFFLVLNPDVTPEKNSILSLLEFMKDNPSAGIAAPKLFLPDGSRQFSVRRHYSIFSLLFSRFPVKERHKRLFYSGHLMSEIDDSKPVQVDWAAGASLMIRSDLARKRGFVFDPRFFLYFEDVDLCIYCKRTGKSVYYVPESVMSHCHMRESAAVFSRAATIHVSSALKFILKYWGFPK